MNRILIVLTLIAISSMSYSQEFSKNSLYTFKYKIGSTRQILNDNQLNKKGTLTIKRIGDELRIGRQVGDIFITDPSYTAKMQDDGKLQVVQLRDSLTLQYNFSLGPQLNVTSAESIKLLNEQGGVIKNFQFTARSLAVGLAFCTNHNPPLGPHGCEPSVKGKKVCHEEYKCVF